MPLNKNILNDQHHYGLGHATLHWLMALAIISLYPLGLYIESLDYYDPAYRIVPNWHKSIGLLVIALLSIRLLWRICNRPPKALPQPVWQKKAASFAHAALYLLLVLTLLSGFLISTADGSPIAFFGLFEVPALPYAIEQQEDIAGEIHFIVATSMIVLVALHAAAALKHHYVDRDSTLKRIFAIKEDA